MSVCPNCQTENQDFAKFCVVCGTKIESATPESAPAEPVADEQYGYTESQNQALQQPVYTQPVCRQCETQELRPSKGKAIAGMVVSIFGLGFSIFGLLYTAIFATLDPLAGFIMGIVFLVFSLPLTIVGLSLSVSSRRQGKIGFNAAGKACGIIALIFCILMVALVVLCIFAPQNHSVIREDFFDLDFDNIHWKF